MVLVVSKKELKKQALNDLKRSGLTETDFRNMGLVPCDYDQAEAVLNSPFAAEGYVIPYFDINGSMIDSVRFKFTEELKNKEGKVIKYSQPKGTPPRLYLPPNVKWKNYLADTSKRIVITEGEKKAYKACKEGIPTIGLGGVWSFKSKKLGKNLIDDFKLIKFDNRDVILCFDNDAKSNTEVMRALNTLAGELINKNANVYLRYLPFDTYQKIGLDDYLLTHNKKDFDKLETEMPDKYAALTLINQEIAYIQTTGKVYVFEHDLHVGSQQLGSLVLANRPLLNEEGKPVSSADSWLVWPQRREHKKLSYSPGGPRVLWDNSYNVWPGWGCPAREGSIKPFADALKKIFDGDEEVMTWFLDWVAYPIQNPGAKMLSAVLLQSVEQGTGKSSIGLTIGAMYGKNFNVVENDDLSSNYNEWAINRQFILGDEILGSDKRTASDKIKNIITRQEVTINKKYMPTYKLVDCINYLLTSNHVDMLNIEPDDRRAFVWKIKKGGGISLRQGIALEKFRCSGYGPGHLLHYFAYEHEITAGFDHRARPPMTEAKAELINNSLTDIERFLTHIKTNPDQALTIDGVGVDRDLFTASQIVNIYMRQHPKARNVSSTAVGKALGKVFNDTKTYSIRTLAGTVRVRPLRNFRKWERASNNDMISHCDRSKLALTEAKKAKFKGSK